MATATLTVQQIIDRCQRDIDDILMAGGGTGSTAPTLGIEYVDRVQQMILGRRPLTWDWMLSVPKKFLTERGQTEYWIGTTTSQAAGEVDTLLNLTDIQQVKPGSVIGRSAHNMPFNVQEAPVGSAWQNEDGSYQEGTPQWYRNDEARANVISLYPAPDTGSDYELVPPAPHSTTAAGGALAARTYYIRTTFVDLEGNESLPSTTARQFVEASKFITVKAPQPLISAGSAGVSYLRWNLYASETEGSETLQNVSPTATSADWTQSVALTTSGASVPTSSTLEPLRGYLIEFRYFKKHTTLTAVGDTLLIPNDFRDVVVAGVNMLGWRYISMTHPEKAVQMQMWQQDFQAGLARMVQAQNRWGGKKFMRPDPGSFVNPYPGSLSSNFWAGGWNPDL